MAELDHLSIDQLAQRWQMLIGGVAPRQNRRYLVKRLAYRIQELAYGGLSTEARTLLAETYQCHGQVSRTTGQMSGAAILPGTCLRTAPSTASPSAVTASSIAVSATPR